MSAGRRIEARRATLFACFALLLIAALPVTGCGESDPPSQTKKIVLPTPATPTAEQCSLGDGGEASGKGERPPDPGTYEYRTTGSRSIEGDSDSATKLPATTQVIITDALRDGPRSCFVTQHRFESNLGDTGIFVVNGDDTLLRSAEFQVGADITEVLPDPPILMLSGSELEWSGSFRGATRGRYAAEIVGRKKFRIDGESVEAVGVETRVSYAGEIEGTERATRWLSTDTRLIVAENVTQERSFGLDRMRLEYRSRLKSLDPR